MTPSVSRRRLLAAAGTAGTAALAGCTGGCGDLPFVGTGMPSDGEIATEPVASVPEEATVLALAELPDEERSLLRTALDTGAVRACMSRDTDRSAALNSFANRLDTETYLADGQQRYGLWVRITDVVYASTAGAPEGDANPCC
jgi:hypothetical protein